MIDMLALMYRYNKIYFLSRFGRFGRLTLVRNSNERVSQMILGVLSVNYYIMLYQVPGKVVSWVKGIQYDVSLGTPNYCDCSLVLFGWN